jgi:hypothetical protein
MLCLVQDNEVCYSGTCERQGGLGVCVIWLLSRGIVFFTRGWPHWRKMDGWTDGGSHVDVERWRFD